MAESKHLTRLSAGSGAAAGDRRRRAGTARGQGLVEFMLVLPILLLLILGTIELGRMFLILTEATSASREASRYGASVGSDGMGGLRYLDCVGMRDAARRMFVMSDVPDSAIAISWDHGDTSQTFATCAAPPSVADIELGDRVVVSVTLLYAPIVPLVPLPPIPINSETARTILIDIAAGPTATVGPPSVPTSTFTLGPTPTASDTPTPSDTPTAGPSPTPTITDTPLPTNTSLPTRTPIPSPGGFQVTVNCTNGQVRFNWNSVPGAHYYGVYEVMDPPPDRQVCLTNKTRCDYSSIPLDGQSHTFYVVAFVYGNRSAPSTAMAVSCPAPGG
ncbi:MAG TPA: TadE/TadG family type IV pilus assembly protein [Anaerolineales bacterium]|nr:TadE/TadG family type IV pilus assembly protein [Anaerolineales bacterium]